MDEEIDIYADLPNINLGDNDNLAEINKKITDKCSQLEKRVAELTLSLESSRKINRNLEVNISSLLQTAKAEIARKDRMIAEIRSELDNIQFRRGSYGRSAKSARRSPQLKRTEIAADGESRVLETPETIEGISPVVRPTNENKRIVNVGEGHRLDGIVSTVFGERLRKRILESQEEEKRQRERSEPTNEEQSLKKSPEYIGVDVAETMKKKRCGDRPTDANDAKRLKYDAETSNDERRTPVNGDAQAKGKTVEQNKIEEERRNKVAARLMLLSEGIDPDIRSSDTVKSEGAMFVDEKKRRNSDEKTRGSRSRSRGHDAAKIRRRDRRSQSITSDEYYKGMRGGKQRDDNRRRNSRDRFDRRRDSKNKDGDNLSEFSREIFDLKERFEQRIGDRSTHDRDERSGSFNRTKRNEDKAHRKGRSRTPDSSESCTKERTTHRSRDDKRYGRSRSRERMRRKDRSSKERRDGSSQNSKSVSRSKIERNEIIEVLRLREKEANAETKSLMSLEDGEIIDSTGSSPKKSIDSNRSFDKAETGSSLPLKEIGNSRIHDGRSSALLHVQESSRSVTTKDCLNSSKDERIENIAEFIANFATDRTPESLDGNKTDIKTNDNKNHTNITDGVKIHCDSVAVTVETISPEEKLENVLSSNIESDDAPKRSAVPSSSPVKNNEPIVANANDGDEDWRLIAIDSPVKNFEENRHNRIMAINAQVMKNPVPLCIPSALPNQSKDSPVVESEAREIPPDETPEASLIQSDNNETSEAKKPIVLRALRSIYRKGRKKMVLSDTSSERFVRNSLANNSTTNHARVRSAAGTEESKDTVEKTDKVSKSQSHASMNNVDKNFNISEDDCNDRQSNNAVRCNDDDFENIANPARDRIVEKDVGSTAVESIDGNNHSLTTKDVATCEETSTNIENNLNSEACNDDPMKVVEDSESGMQTPGESGETNIEDSSDDSGKERTKDPAKEKLEPTDKKVKRELQKLVVLARRRKPVRLEDSSTSFGESLNDREKTDGYNDEIEAPISSEVRDDEN